MSRTSLFFTVIAAVLLGGFAWLEFHQTARPPAPILKTEPWQPPQTAHEVLEQLRQQKNREVEVELVGPGGKTKTLMIPVDEPSNEPANPVKEPKQVATAKDMLEQAREQRRQESIIQVEEGDDTGDLDDETKFQRLLERVRSPEGFSKRFEVDTIKTLRDRGYNPDGSPIDLDQP